MSTIYIMFGIVGWIVTPVVLVWYVLAGKRARGFEVVDEKGSKRDVHDARVV